MYQEFSHFFPPPLLPSWPGRSPASSGYGGGLLTHLPASLLLPTSHPPPTICSLRAAKTSLLAYKLHHVTQLQSLPGPLISHKVKAVSAVVLRGILKAVASGRPLKPWCMWGPSKPWCVGYLEAEVLVGALRSWPVGRPQRPADLTPLILYGPQLLPSPCFVWSRHTCPSEVLKHTRGPPTLDPVLWWLVTLCHPVQCTDYGAMCALLCLC